MKGRVFNLAGLNLKMSPYLQQEGEMSQCVNMETDMLGAKKKRPGYTTYLGTPDNNRINTLFNYTTNSGTQFWNYRFSVGAAGTLYYSTQGTGAWTVCGGGTFAGGGSMGYANTEDTLIIGNGVDATRHSTNGTSFTNTSSAPIAGYFTDFQNRIYAGGTASSLFWSAAGTPTQWVTDSSSIQIPGPGRINAVMKAYDRVLTSKNSGVMHRYDGDSLFDLATELGPTSASSIATREGYRFWVNRLGIFGYGGVRPELLSNPIERQVYNDAGSGVVGTQFTNAPGVSFRYDYLLGVGTVTDDLTGLTLNRGIEKYDYQLDEWGNWEFNNMPTAFGTYTDASGIQQLIFGDSAGQCYTFGGTVTTDNTATIASRMLFYLHAGAPESDKEWKYLWLFFNPGNQAKVQVAISDTFTAGKLNWVDLGDCSDGVAEFRFPAGSRGKFLFVKIYEASRNNRFQFYGFAYDAEVIDRK